MPDPAPKRPRLKHRTPAGSEVILLSAFDGIGAAPWLLWDLVGEPAAIFTWETDKTALAVAKGRVPGIQNRGDIAQDSPDDVAAQVDLGGALFCAAPPCQDFSRVADGQGHDGDRGSLFLSAVEFMLEIRRLVAPRRFGFIFENVEMSTADAKQISSALGAQPILVDAADFGWIGRPRLWWLSANWNQMRLGPETGDPLQWSRKGPWDRLRVEEARRAADTLDMDGFIFDDSVLSGTSPVPPPRRPTRTAERRAEGAVGRYQPTLSRGGWQTGASSPPDTVREAMAVGLDGKLSIPAPKAKEQLHHIPGEMGRRGRDRRPGGAGGPTTHFDDRLGGDTAARSWGRRRPSTTAPTPWSTSTKTSAGIDRRPSRTPTPAIEPAWDEGLEIRRRWRHDLARIRREVVDEV